MIWLEDLPLTPSPSLQAKLAMGETPAGELRQALSALELIRADLWEALTDDTGRLEVIAHARNNLAGVSSTIQRALTQLEAR